MTTPTQLIAQAQLGDHRALAITPEDLEKLSKPQMVEMVMALQRKMIVRHTDQGIKQGVVQIVPLRIGQEVMQFMRKDGTPIGDPFITAKGYYRLAAAMGFTIKTARTVIVDGEEQGNPYLMRDPDTRMVEAIYVRKIVMGRNSNGNLIARDQTVIFSPWAYLVEDLQVKEGFAENASAIMGTSFMVGDRPDEPGWAYIAEVKLPGGSAIGLKVDAADPSVRTVLKAYAERMKKAVEIAQTFADRNALKKVLGVPESPPLFNGCAYIPVVSWIQADRDWHEINAAVADIESPDSGVRLESDVAIMSTVDASTTAAQVADVGDVSGWSSGDATTAEAEEATIAAAAAAVEGADANTTAGAPESIHTRTVVYEDDVLAWVTWMVTRGEMYAADDPERFAAICAELGTDSTTWANHGQELMRAVIKACEA